MYKILSIFGLFQCKKAKVSQRDLDKHGRISIFAPAITNWPCGEIGRHAILRGWCCKAWEFESPHGHTSISKLSTYYKQ